MLCVTLAKILQKSHISHVQMLKKGDLVHPNVGVVVCYYMGTTTQQTSVFVWMCDRYSVSFSLFKSAVFSYVESFLTL